MAGVQILDAAGQPMKPLRKVALQGAGPGHTPYDAADYQGEHTRDWRPGLYSQDVSANGYRDTIVARVRDVVRNDGWASGLVTRITDNVIGASFRPVSKPDYRALAAYTGDGRFDAVWADEYRRAADAHYRTWANDEGRYCDAERSKWMSLIYGVAFRHLLQENDALAVMQWAPERLGLGRARYATCVKLVDPDRMSNPQNRFDWKNVRGGVELDELEAAIAYHVRRAHQGDYWAAGESVTWERIEREDDYGRPIAVHYFEPEWSGQHRGSGTGIFTPVLQRLKMIFRMDVAELDSALLNALMFAVAESPFDHSLMEEAIGDEPAGGMMANNDGVRNYQDGRAEFHDERRIRVGSSRIITAYPGEKYNIVKPERPNPNYAPFLKNALRNVAAAAGAAPHQITNDYSDVNYTSLVASLQEAWKTITRRRHNFGAGFCGPIRSAWLEESMVVDDYPLPSGAPEFAECRQAYGACEWRGPGRGVINPVDERRGALLGIGGGLTSRSQMIAESSDLDVEEVFDLLQVEEKMRTDRGLQPFITGEGSAAKPTEGTAGTSA